MVISDSFRSNRFRRKIACIGEKCGALWDPTLSSHTLLNPLIESSLQNSEKFGNLGPFPFGCGGELKPWNLSSVQRMLKTDNLLSGYPFTACVHGY